MHRVFVIKTVTVIKIFPSLNSLLKKYDNSEVKFPNKWISLQRLIMIFPKIPWNLTTIKTTYGERPNDIEIANIRRMLSAILWILP